jgi:hypothetical protein
MEEKYYVPSLLVNAIREQGYQPQYINPWTGFEKSTDIFKRALTKYLVKRVE